MIGVIQKVEDGKVYVQTDSNQLFIFPIDYVDYVNPHAGDKVFLVKQQGDRKYLIFKQTRSINHKSKKLSISIGVVAAAIVVLIGMIALCDYNNDCIKKKSESGKTILKSASIISTESFSDETSSESSVVSSSQTEENAGMSGSIELSKDNPHPVIYQDENYLIKASSITYSNDMYHFHFSATNNTDTNLYVDVTQANVDDDNTWIQTYSYGSYNNVAVKNRTTQVDAGGIEPGDLEKLGLKDFKILKLEVTIQDMDNNEIAVVDLSVPKSMLPT